MSRSKQIYRHIFYATHLETGIETQMIVTQEGQLTGRQIRNHKVVWRKIHGDSIGNVQYKKEPVPENA
jgi:hypothetical protein